MSEREHAFASLSRSPHTHAHTHNMHNITALAAVATDSNASDTSFKPKLISYSDTSPQVDDDGKQSLTGCVSAGRAGAGCTRLMTKAPKTLRHPRRKSFIRGLSVFNTSMRIKFWCH